MGNRILKESITMSLEIDQLTWFEEVLFYRLIVTVDDYGVYPADPVLLSHMLFPRKENVSRRMTEEALNHLEQLRLIRRYRAGDKGMFLQLVSWEKHQRLRNTRRKYPGPPEEETAEECPEETAACEVPERKAAEEKTEERTETEPESSGPPVVTLPLNDGSEFPVTQADADEYASLYPAVDVYRELRSMRGWCLSNETKRKTRSGIKRFINSWMSRAQDRGGPPDLSRGSQSWPVNPYLEIAYGGASE